MTKNHEQVTVLMPHKSRLRQVHVDKGIVPFLRGLWEGGFDTTGSCQEFRPGLARVWFRYGSDVARFMRMYPDSETEGSLVVDFPSSHLASGLTGERHPESQGGLT